MSKAWWKSNKKDKTEKEVTSKSVVDSNDGQVVHASTVISFTRQLSSTTTVKTETYTAIQTVGCNSSKFSSQTSLNSFTERSSTASGSNSSLQLFGKNPDLNSGRKLSSISTNLDTVPFTSAPLYKPAPYRSAFTSAPLTGTSKAPVNSGCQLSSVNDRNRSVNALSPINSSLIYPSVPNNRGNISTYNNSEELRKKLTVKVQKSTKFYDDPAQTKVPTYVTRSKHRGMLLLINNIKFVNEKHQRKGAELDEENVVQLFKQMGFEVLKYRNLTKKDMGDKITGFRNNSTLKKVDIGAVVVMSHGTGKEMGDSTEVFCTDGELLHTTWIINQFDGEKCRYLSGKPKIFIFQCCRGDNKDIVQIDGSVVPAPRKLSDMLIAYSTIPGFVSHRDPEHGTWYIQAICKVFMEHAYDTDVENLLKIVDGKLSYLVSNSGSKQTTSFENRGFKTCYLHPQKYE